MTACRHSANPRFDTLLLVLVAGAALSVTRTCIAWQPVPMAVRTVGEVLMSLILGLCLCYRARSDGQAKCLAGIAAGIVGIYPFAAELALRQFASGSEPLEFVMLTALQLTATVLALFGRLPRLAKVAVLFSSFQLLFVTTMLSNWTNLVLASIYGALLLWWLMGAYWDRLAGAFVASTVQRRIPMRVSVIGGTATVSIVLATIIGAKGGAAVALPGIAPVSGGTRWHDSHAHSGVGDGDAIVAAREEAQSFGPVESELFLDSEMPTLYDMFNDLYGDPPKPKTQQQRSIALPVEDIREADQKIARTERSGREFSAVRRRGACKSKTLDDRRAAAMMYVVGSVPVHLALERYDEFDGRVWSHSGIAEACPSIRLQQTSGKPWACVTRAGGSSVHRDGESHALKFINLKTNRFPSPPRLAAIHIDKVDQPEFYGWTADGVACMPVCEHLPQLTVVHVRSQKIDLHALRESDATSRLAAVAIASPVKNPAGQAAPTERAGRPPELSPPGKLVSRTAAEWVGETPHGWHQVEAVVERLRADFTLDPHATAPEDCRHVVSHFLQTRRGPDYLFASSAAVVLRELGFPTRLVAGFYANQDRYDQRARQTAVLAEDVHVWVEVNIDGHGWLPVEPTPGYQLPHKSLTWGQYAMSAWRSACRWCGEHLALLAMGLTVVATGWFARVQWLDGALTLICQAAGRIDSRRRVLWTMWLLEWRGWLTGRPRPGSKTLSHWYGALLPSLPQTTATCLESALRSAETHLYAAGHPLTLTPLAPDQSAACATVERQVRARCFRNAFHQAGRQGKAHD